LCKIHIRSVPVILFLSRVHLFVTVVSCHFMNVSAHNCLQNSTRNSFSLTDGFLLRRIAKAVPVPQKSNGC